jgi:hypothetical protein
MTRHSPPWLCDSNAPVSPLQTARSPGNVKQSQLDAVISGTANNSNRVNILGLNLSDLPEQWQVQQIADKLDELIQALRR